MKLDPANPSWLNRMLQPARPNLIPHRRFWSIFFRTTHLMVISILVGGHAFSAPAQMLKPVLYVAIVTGAALIVLEGFPTLHFVFEGWGLMVLSKLALLCLIPFFWNRRFPILLVVIAIASIGSHMQARLRHYSFLYHRVFKP